MDDLHTILRMKEIQLKSPACWISTNKKVMYSLSHTAVIVCLLNLVSTLPVAAATQTTDTATEQITENNPANDENDAMALQNAKSDLLQLDRELSRLEHQIIYPERTLVLFGLSPKSKNIISQLSVAIDAKPVLNHFYSKLELDSLKSGGMTEVFDNNLSKGRHTIDVMLTDTFTQKTYSQQFVYNKTKNKSILGIRFIERPPPRTLPIRLLEWPLDE